MEAVAGRPKPGAADGAEPVLTTGEALAERDQAQADGEAETRGGPGNPCPRGRRMRRAIRAVLEIGLVGID